MAKTKSRKGEARPSKVQTKPGKPEAAKSEEKPEANRRASTVLHQTEGKTIAQASDVQRSSRPDIISPGAAVAQTNAGSVGIGVVSAEAFIELVNRGIKSWTVAGELLATWLSIEPTAYQLIRNKAPWISIATLEIFERLGRHSLYPKVLLLPPMLSERVGRLSYAVQERMCALPENEVRALVATKSATHVKHKDRGRDCQRPGPAPQERSHIANLPCAGYFKLTLNGTDASLHRCAKDDRSVPVVLNDANCVVLQIMSRHEIQSESNQTPEALSPTEKAWREFKAT